MSGPPPPMSDPDLAERLDAVERALTDGDTDLTGLRESAAVAEDVTRLEQRMASLEESVEELEAAVEAVRGYTGNVRAVNRDVERRASAALAKVEALERAVGAESTPHGDGGPQSGRERTPDRVGENSAPEHAAQNDHRTRCDDRGTPCSEERSEQRVSAVDRDSPGRCDGDADGTEQFIQRVRDAL